MYDLQKCIELAVLAGLEIMKIYKSNTPQTFVKKDGSPVTLADQLSNKIIIEGLAQFNIPIISEEIKNQDYSVREKWDLAWSIDPLDGTKEFLNKNGEFTVNIALIQKGKPILGIIYAPALEELYVGDVLNKKAYKQEKITSILSLNHSKTQNLPCFSIEKNKIILLKSRSHFSEKTQNYIDQLKPKASLECISKGSSLKLCWIADGKANIYPKFADTMEWDIAAGHAICNAIGIQVINIDTKEELNYNKKKLLNPWFIINNIWHD